MKLLTIVVPSYNMQNYLHNCLDSLLVRPILMAKFEVLVINDGSNDDTSSIAHSYQDRYPNTFRVIDKENGNYGSCVNRGLAEAEGKYIKVLDADDWFDKKAFESYLNELGQYEVDIVISDYQTVDSDGRVLRESHYNIEENMVFSFQSLSQPNFFTHHSIAYSTSLLRELGYRQTEGIYYTDQEWVLCPQLFAKNAVYLKTCVYRYWIGRADQSSNPVVSLKSCWHRIRLLKRLYLIPQEWPGIDRNNFGYKNYESCLEDMTCGVYKDLLVKTRSSDFDPCLLKDFEKSLYNSRPDIYDDLGRKLVLKVFPIHYVLYWRKFGKRFPVDLFRKVYRTLKYKN